MSVAITESINTQVPIGADELLALSNEKDFEIVNGLLVERQMGFESSHIAVHLAALLFFYNQSRGIGWVQGSDCGYQLQLSGGTSVRKPDVSFVSFQKLSSAGGFPAGYPAVVPDLAVEVLSPNDLAYEVEQKINDYLEAGVQLIWIINPAGHSVQVFRQDGSIDRLLESELLDGEAVLPGFTCRIETLFQVPQPGGTSS